MDMIKQEAEKNHLAGLDKVIHPGTNGKMNEISAAMGLTSFESIDKLISKNRSNYNLYENLLSNITGLKTIIITVSLPLMQYLRCLN